MAEAFSYEGYRELLAEYRDAGYGFASFPEAMQADLRAAPPLVLMRHDIDFDLGAARAMAEVEARQNVQATYFFLVRTDHYNLFSKDGSAEVRRILELGHHLGLHFDCASYPENTSDARLAEFCRNEANMLANWFESTVEIVSYHRPSPSVLTGNPELSAPLPHAYMARFMKEMKYCSDSRGEWRYGDPRSTAEFAARRPMQILIHPVWWNEDRRHAGETLSRWLDTRIDWLDTSMAANCTVYQRRGKR